MNFWETLRVTVLGHQHFDLNLGHATNFKHVFNEPLILNFLDLNKIHVPLKYRCLM